MSNITFENFMKKEFERNQYKALYKSFANFKRERLKGYGCFKDWLIANSNTSPSVQFIHSLVKTYVEHANKNASEIPYLLVSIEREHKIEIPVIYGITTQEYWEKLIK